MTRRTRALSLIAAVALLGTGLLVTTSASATQTTNGIAAATPTPISQGRPVLASSTRSGFPATNAVDGKTATRWASGPSVTQWLVVDLGLTGTINRVKLVWDKACASSYRIETSNDQATWTKIFSTSKGNGGTDTLTVSGSGRYVRVLMSHRCPGAPGKGYSLREFQVFGTVPLLPPGHPRIIRITCYEVEIGWDTPVVPPAAIDAFRDGQFVGTVPGTSTSIVIGNLHEGVSYTIYLDARDPAGNTSPPTDPILVNTPPCTDRQPPDPPTNVHATDIGSACVTLAWDPAHDNDRVVAYRIYADGNPVGQTPDTSIAICGLKPSTTYRFQVSAVDASGNESAKSPVFIVTTKPGCTEICGVTQVGVSTDIPWGLVTLPDGSILFTERDTANLVHLTGSGVSKVVGHVPNVSTTNGEGGLTGLEISPTFASDHWLYFFHTSPTDSRIVRIKYTSGALDVGTEQVLVSGIARNKFRDGGRLRFGPDRKLYAGTGDAQGATNAQDIKNLNGKILRLNPDGTVPPDNPFANYVWSYGHRNVQGLAFDSQGRLWASEFGENRFDELNLIVKGGNYGWPLCEGTAGSCGGFIAPVRTFPVASASPAGIAIVHDVIYMAALRGARLYRMTIIGSGTGTPQQFFIGQFGRLRTVEPAPDGGLWLTTSNGDGVGGPRHNLILHVLLGTG